MPSIAYATDDVNAQPSVEATAEEPATGETAEPEATEVAEPNTAGAASVEPIVGKVTVSNTLNSAVLENGIVTLTAKAPATTVGSPETNDVTIYNETDSEAVLKFDYVADNCASSNLPSTSGTYKKVLAAGGSLALHFTAGAYGSEDAVLTLSNFSLEAIADSYDITISYDDKLGSVTAGGTAIANGDIKTVGYSDGLALVAEPKEGSEFLGWIDAKTNELYSEEASYTINPTANEEVKAVFINEASDAYFLVSGKYLVEGVNNAGTKAASTAGKKMVLMNDATLKEGNYAIPAGVTMLIPFDDENTLYTDAPEATNEKYVTPTAYRTLKMADGAVLTVNGKLSLSAIHYAANGGGLGSGAPTGEVSFLDMEKGSSVVLNDGAYLYAYGYIVGEGTVTAKDGATVYENFQINDFRGGSATSALAVDDTLIVEGEEKGKNHGVLPISQYYVQNIEVPLTLEAGAAEYTYTTVYMNSDYYGAAVAFISDRYAMFNLSSGNVVKSYDGDTDRLIVEANGSMSLSPITIKLKGVEEDIDSSNFELPINNNITVKINKGDVEIDQDIVLLPGAEIIIAKNAKCTLVDGTNVYVYDAEQWGGFCGSGNEEFLPIRYAYSKNCDRTQQPLVDASVLVNGVLDASEGYLYTTTNSNYDLGYGNIYSTGGGVIKMLSGGEYATYQATQNGIEVVYDEICILPANLKQNSKDNPEYLQALDEDGVVGTYTYTDGVWLCDHKHTENVTAEADCTTAGAKTVKCDLYHEYNLTIPAKGHKAVTDPAVKGSCTVDAKTEGSHCSVCNEVIVAQVVTEAPGHTEVVDKGYAATCLEDGLTDGKHCSVCKEVTEKQEVIKAVGTHDWDLEAGQAPTCTEDGYGSSKCKACGEEVKGDTIPKLGHDYKWTVTTAPTCTKEGVKEGVCQREGCGHKTTGVVEATGHSFKNYVDNKDATCDKAGTATAKCENEGCNETDDKDTEALGHLWKKDGTGQLLYEVVTAPTCTAKGSEAVHCEREGCKATDKAREIDALGHTEQDLKAVAPTCTEKGLSAGVKCSVCDEILTAQTEVSSLGGHKWDEGVIAKLPTVDISQNAEGETIVTPVSGKRVFECQNTGCKESKEEILNWGSIKTYDEFIKNLEILEDWAFEYAIKNNIEDPAALVIRYIRTGVDRYNSGSWQIMAGFDNTKFTDYVSEKEIKTNDLAKTEADKVNVTGLKNISNFTLPNGDKVDFGHMFGTIDISYTKKNSINHADVAGFFGDTTDLLTTADRFGVEGTIEEMVKDITDNYFLVDANWDDKFGNTDMLGDLDGYYINRELLSDDYEKGMLTDIMSEYFTSSLTEKQRAEYYLEYRLKCGTSKAAVRDAVYMAYTGNSVIATLEGTREFTASGDKLEGLRKAACYAVADYICRLAGDYVEYVENNQFTVQSEQFATLAPGITQEIKTAKKDYVNAEGEIAQHNMKYYIVTSDITRDDVMVWANYPTRPIEKDADGNYVWDRKRVLDQAEAAQKTYGDPESDLYIENFNVIASTNADGYDMTGNRGEPGGLLVMDGEEIYPIAKNGFFGIKKDGTAVIGTSEEYNNIYRSEMKEAVGGFGSMLVQDGKIVATGTGDLHSRTAVGITGSGKVVMMVLDGRQELSKGGDMLDLAHIMHDAGCVAAINLDGGGSSTYVAKQPGDDKLSVMNSPSDGYQRDVASSLIAISTAKSSTVFDHAVLKTPTNYMTVGSEMQITADGATSTENAVDIPEGATWAVNEEDAKDATISADGVLKALRTGTVTVNLMLDGISVGSKQINIVVPDSITFTKPSVDVVYESSVTLPIKAYYEGKAVTINPNDFEFTVSNEAAGAMKEGTLDFVAAPESTGLKRIEVTAKVKAKDSITAKITVALYKQGENTFDFDKKTGGDREFAWLREVSNAETGDNTTYYAVDKNKDMETSYVFAIDMTAIPMPEVLEELTVMLPGHDVEGACAWTYLCDLAQRISDITEVTATVKIDDRFELVDPEKITVKNEYFQLPKDGSGIVYDKETNTVTLKLNWVRQYSPIDREMANPLCLVNGIKLVPKKNADWGANKEINAINEGSVSYKVYMRASSLYTFSKDPENQKKYGLKEFSYTYIDKNGIEQLEQGGGFESTYKTFKDSYNLVNAAKNGWVVEDGGWRYYEDGEALKGVQLISEMVGDEPQSLYYDFGDEGIIKGSKKETYTGFIKNSDGTYSYSSIGVLVPGWIEVDNEWYYFKEGTKKSLGAGKHKLTIKAQNQHDIDPGPGRVYETITNDVTYEFDAKGKVLNGGTWFTDKDGKHYYYFGPAFQCGKWNVRNGKQVYLSKAGYLKGGIISIKTGSTDPTMYYMFDSKTFELIKVCEGFVKYNGVTYYYVPKADIVSGKYSEDEMINGRLKGLQKINNKYYLFSETNGKRLTGKQAIYKDADGKCSVATFHKTYGYAVDSKGKALTKLTVRSAHSYVASSVYKATSSRDGYRIVKCKYCGVTKKIAINKIGSFKLSTTKYTYNGGVKKPIVTVLDSKGNKISSTYYTVKYSAGRKAVGRYKAVVTFKGRYYGTKTLYFTIVPKAPAKVSATLYGYDDVKVSWSKATGASGYAVYYKKAADAGYTLLTRTAATAIKKANLTDGVQYTFKIVPYYKSGGVRYGALTYKTASIYTMKKLDTPVVTDYSAKAVKVSWNDIPGQTGYQLSRTTTKLGTKVVYTYASTTAESKTLSATKGKTYYFKVRPYKTVGKTKIYGPWSTAVKFIPGVEATETPQE